MPTYQDDPIVSRNHAGNPAFDGGVYGESKLFNGVRGITYAPGHGAVVGVSEVPTPNPPDEAKNPGPGVYGQGNGVGVVGVGLTWVGVYGETRAAPGAGSCGVLGEGQSGGIGVKGQARAPGQAGVAGYQLENRGPGVYGEGAPAGYFKGDVAVTGDLLLEGADYAEELTAAETGVGPGMVVVLDDEGRIAPCNKEYDPRVAGIVSGAGGVRPGIVLDRHEGGAAVALMGKLWVLADATETPIRCADQLTTSTTRGHARRVTERERAFGAVIGKALTDLLSGRGLVRVLVSAS